jgi:hypothetical protein
MFPDAHVIEISSHGNSPTARVFDVEYGAIDYADAPALVTRARQNGIVPWVYVSMSKWQMMKDIFASAGVAEPLWWIANWGADLAIPAGAIGLQYGGGPGYDLSIMVDYIPGLDSPLGPTGEDDDMAIEMIRSDTSKTDKEGGVGNGAVIAHLGAGVLEPVPPSTFETWVNEGRPVNNLAQGPWTDYTAFLARGQADAVAAIERAIGEALSRVGT